MAFHMPLKELQPVDTSLPEHVVKVKGVLRKFFFKGKLNNNNNKNTLKTRDLSKIYSQSKFKMKKIPSKNYLKDEIFPEYLNKISKN